jgi:hypothetical protein
MVGLDCSHVVALAHISMVVFSMFQPLVLCDGDAEVCPGVSCLSSSPPIVRPQPALQAGCRGKCPLGYG